MTRTFAASLAALGLSALVAASATPAAAENGRNAALFGGLAAGALIGGAIAANATPAPPPPAPVYQDVCYTERQPVLNRWGDVVGYRRVRVCD